MSTIKTVRTEISKDEYNALLTQSHKVLSTWAEMDMMEKGYHPAGYGHPMRTRLQQDGDNYFVTYDRYDSCD